MSEPTKETDFCLLLGDLEWRSFEAGNPEVTHLSVAEIKVARDKAREKVLAAFRAALRGGTS